MTNFTQVVDINQADPQSNAIHVAHNIPKDSDITVVQTNPFNTTVHISMNVGTGSKVLVHSIYCPCHNNHIGQLKACCNQHHGQLMKE